MSRVPAAGRLPRGRLRGSVAAVPLRPPRPPARRTSACQNRHLGAGSTRRAATGCREGQEGARMRGGTRVDADSALRSASRGLTWRPRGGARTRGRMRAEVSAEPRRPPSLRSCPRAFGAGLSPVRFLAGPAPQLTPQPRAHTQYPTFPPTSRRDPPFPRAPGSCVRLLSPGAPAVLEKCLFV